MASDGPESKAVSQAPDQDGEGESSEQLTKFVSLVSPLFSCFLASSQGVGSDVDVFIHFFYTYIHSTIGGRIARKHGKSEREGERERESIGSNIVCVLGVLP